MDENIESVSYFTGMQGVFGEAAGNCESDTQIGQIVFEDGSVSDDKLRKLAICVITTFDGQVCTGSDPRGSRDEAYKDAYRQLV